MEYLSLLMFVVACVILLIGYPVAISLSATALMFAYIGLEAGIFDYAFLAAFPNRLFGIMTNEILIAVPLFIFMGIMLERTKIAENLLEDMALLFGKLRGGLGLSVTFVGMLLAASTGIVGATVVTMGLLSLPSMLRNHYDPKLAAGTICASGTLGQIIPPSIVLVILGDVISSAYQKAQLDTGIFAPDTVSVGDLFVGALIPGCLLVVCYMLYIAFIAWRSPARAPAISLCDNLDLPYWQLVKRSLTSLMVPIALIFAVLGSILAGIATPTEAASVGAVGALLLALQRKQLTLSRLQEIMRSTTQMTSMVFFILIGASVFSLVFRGLEGDSLIQNLFAEMPGGLLSATLLVMLIIFLLGFILDFIEISFVVVPIVAPILLSMGLDPIWLGIMIALNLQTSFLTPPFGFSLFYLRGVAPASLSTHDIYKGVIPFILIQLCVLVLLALWPDLATWLPNKLYR